MRLIPLLICPATYYKNVSVPNQNKNKLLFRNLLYFFYINHLYLYLSIKKICCIYLQLHINKLTNYVNSSTMKFNNN